MNFPQMQHNLSGVTYANAAAFIAYRRLTYSGKAGKHVLYLKTSTFPRKA
jgi:hypothetical protein